MLAQRATNTQASSWGITFKRQQVDLPVIEGVIGKRQEKLAEIVNILATNEQTLSALTWFADEFPCSIVQEFHPSTSDNPDGHDITLVN